MNTIMDCAVRCAAKRNEASTPGGRRSRGGFNAANKVDKFTSPQACKKTMWDYMDQLEAMGLTPDRYTCSTLVKGMSSSACGGPCGGDQIDRAIRTLKTLGGLTKDADAESRRLYEVLFNSLLDACVNSSDMTRMAQVFQTMRDAGVPVSAVTFGTLIKAFGNAQRVDRCSECWAEMKAARVTPSPVTFGCYIDALVKNGELERAQEIFKEMPEAGCEPNTIVYT